MWRAFKVGASALAVTVLSTTTPAQTTLHSTAVYGRVVSQQQEPVQNSRILVVSEVDGKAFTLQSDSNGVFSIPALAPGKYEIHAFAAGAGMADGEFQVQNQEKLEVDITLAPTDTTTVNVTPDAVTVEPYLVAPAATLNEIRDVPASLKVIRLEDRLGMLPGVVQNTRNNVNVDGMPDDQTRWTLDGLRIDPVDPSVTRPQVPLLGIREVQVIHAGFDDAPVGPGGGGTVAVVSKESGEGMRFDYDDPIPGFGFGSQPPINDWRPRAVVCGPLGPVFSFCDSANLDYSNWWVPGLPQGQNAVPQWFADNLYRMQWNGRKQAVFGGFLTSRHTVQNNGIGPTNPINVTRDQTDDFNFVYSRYQRMIGKAVLSLGGAYFDEGDTLRPHGDGLELQYPWSNEGSYYRNLTESGTRGEGMAQVLFPTLTGWGTHTITIGSGLSESRFSMNEKLTGYELFNSSSQPLNETLFGTMGTFGLHDGDRYAFAEDAWQPSKNIVVIAGTRWDADEAIHAGRVTPRLSAAYTFSKVPVRVYAGFSYIPMLVNPVTLSKPNEWTVYQGLTIAGKPNGSASVTRYVPNVSPLAYPEIRNMNTGISFQAPGRVNVDLGYLRKNTSDGLGYMPSNVTGFPLPPGLPAKAVIHTDVFGNNTDMRYNAAEIGFRKHFCNDCDLFAHYTHAIGSSNASIDPSNFSPYVYTNLSGPLPWVNNDRMVSGGRFPWRAYTFGAFLNFSSGTHYSLYYPTGQEFGTPNAFTMPSQYIFNLEIARQVPVSFHSNTRLLELVVTIFNVPNTALYTTVNTNLAAPTRFLGSQPRSLNISVRKSHRPKYESAARDDHDTRS